MLMSTPHGHGSPLDKKIREAFCESLGLAHKQVGDPKWPLPNLQSSSELEFWKHRTMSQFSAEAWTNAQKINDCWAHVMIYFTNHGYLMNGGFAVVITYQAGSEKVEYFKWGKCRHLWREKSLGNCQHRVSCSACEAKFEYDSSD